MGRNVSLQAEPTQQTATSFLPFAPIIITPPANGDAQRQFWYLRLRAIRGQAKALEIQRRALLQEAAAIERHFEGKGEAYR